MHKLNVWSIKIYIPSPEEQCEIDNSPIIIQTEYLIYWFFSHVYYKDYGNVGI